MTEPLRLLNRAPYQALAHYLAHHKLSLPRHYVRDALQLVVQGLMEIDVSQNIEASLYERRSGRRAYRNGYRASSWGDIAIRVPKLRAGTYVPNFLTVPDAEAMLQNFVLRHYLNPTDERFLAKLLHDLRIEAHAYQIAEVHEPLYDLTQQHQNRLLKAKRIWLDSITVEQRGKPRKLAIATDEQEILAHDITPDADEAFWQDFIRRIDQRSVRTVEYIAIGQLATVIRLTTDHTTTQMFLAA